MFITRKRYEELLEEVKNARDRARAEFQILFEARDEAQRKCIHTLKSENRMLLELLREIGAKVEEQIEPTVKFASELSDPTEVKFTHISLDKRFISSEFIVRLQELERRIKESE